MSLETAEGLAPGRQHIHDRQEVRHHLGEVGLVVLEHRQQAFQIRVWVLRLDDVVVELHQRESDLLTRTVFDFLK